MHPSIDRITKNAKYLIDHHRSARDLLHVAMKEAVPWAMPLVTQGAIPQLPAIERLATQLVAIIIASEPEASTPTSVDVIQAAKE